jgi:hypothetical protein
MQRNSVRSSNIKSVGYDESSAVLEVEFHSTGIYQYRGVSKEIYKDFMAASSKGRYFERHIKDRFPTTKVR